jgi:hypothetical protein
VQGAECRRRYSDVTLEGFREVALVGEAGIQSDLDQWRLRFSEPPAGYLNSELADVLTQGAALILPERACEVVSGDPYLCGDLVEGQVFGEMCAQKLVYTGEPTRCVRLRNLGRRSRACRQKLEDQTLHRQGRDAILLPALRDESLGEPDRRSALVVGWTIKDGCSRTEPLKPRLSEFNMKGSAPRIVPAVGVSQGGGINSQGQWPARGSSPIAGLRAMAFQEEAEESVGMFVRRDDQPWGIDGLGKHESFEVVAALGRSVKESRMKFPRHWLLLPGSRIGAGAQQRRRVASYFFAGPWIPFKKMD